MRRPLLCGVSGGWHGPRVLAAALLTICLAAPASADARRLEIAGTAQMTFTRPASDATLRSPDSSGPSTSGDLTITVPAEFEAALTLVSHGGRWMAREGEVKATVLGQALRLRVRTAPEDELFVEINGVAAGWGRREELALVPLIGAPVALGLGPSPEAAADDPAWHIEFLPAADGSAPLTVVLHPPGDGELLRFQVALGPPDAAQGTRPWAVEGGLGPLDVTGPEQAPLQVDRFAWTGAGELAPAGPSPLNGSVTLEARLGVPGTVRADCSAQVRLTLRSLAEAPAEPP